MVTSTFSVEWRGVMTQVRAVYEFEAQPNSGELSISVDEVLTVLREGIEGGWLEGRNSRGQLGLFPESYVVKIDPTPAAPVECPPALPAHSLPPTTNDDNWGFPPATPAHMSAPVFQQPVQTIRPSYPSAGTPSGTHEEDDFDDWSEDDEELAETLGNATGVAKGTVSRSRSAGAETLTAKQGTVRMKNINRFSNFVKSGMESFVLSSTKMTTKPEERHEIILTEKGPEWAPLTQRYTCTVDKPKKESKLKGLKSFIAYSVTSSLSGIQVSRRYKHFDWLHEQMSAKYLLIPIPPLPEKQVAGRYEEDLIEHRKNILQLWVNKVCRHPVLSKSDVWIHFLTCTDEKQWKNGKRKAEKDEYVGGNFLHCVTVPTQSLDSNRAEHQVEGFARVVRSLDDSVRVMYDRVTETHKRLAGPYRSNWQKMAAAIAGLGHSFELDSSPSNQIVTAALKETAHVFHKIGDEHEESAKRDLDPLLDCLYSYKGLLAGMPDIVNVHKSAMSKLRENERLSMEGKVSTAEADRIRTRVDSISYAVLAEIEFQHRERGEDFKRMMATYLERQAAFYDGIGKQLAALAVLFKNA
uniref:Sorting nexin n=1 Tax=Ascaris suum TaxID=6253 RepID=F1KW84_ASCSU